MSAISLRRGTVTGQALTEFALVFPIALMLFVGIIVLGLYVFYSQEVTNAAREAARYAAIHSSTAQCPTVSWRDPTVPSNSYYRCDSPNDTRNPYPWPNMTDAARAKVFGIAPTSVMVNACWSGYVPAGSPAGTLADSPPTDPATGNLNTLVQCSIGGVDPIANGGALACGMGLTTSADDPASDQRDNRVTAYACMVWRPPMAGLLLVPAQVTIRGIVTEIIQRQQ